ASFATPDIKIESITDKNIIKFRAVGNELFKIHLYNGTVRYQKIADYQVLAKEIKTYLEGISDINISVNKLKTQGRDIYAKLFQQNLNPTVPIVIIPDDILYYLPFGLLVENNRYLLENHMISYTANFSFLNAAMVKSKKRN